MMKDDLDDHNQNCLKREREIVMVKKYRCVFLLQTRGDSETLVDILHYMVVSASPRWLESLYGGVFRSPAHVW